MPTPISWLSSRFAGRTQLFSEFDALCEGHDMEKIKTIGGAYMAAAGVPDYLESPAAAAANMALGMLEVIPDFSSRHGTKLDLRVGLHSGRLTAGIIGIQWRVYDLWGGAVNTAARMDSHRVAGRV